MMMTPILYKREKVSRLDPSQPLFSGIKMASGAQSLVGQDIRARLASLEQWTTSIPSHHRAARERVGSADERRSLEARLFDALAAAKVMTSKVSMHLDPRWRARLFASLDHLLTVDNWHEDDPVLDIASFETYLRFVLFVAPNREPMLGVSNHGNLLAGWIAGKDRLSCEFLAHDGVRWVLSRYLDDERESAAGQVTIVRLIEVLKPFNPEAWLSNGASANP